MSRGPRVESVDSYGTTTGYPMWRGTDTTGAGGATSDGAALAGVDTAAVTHPDTAQRGNASDATH
jgi:hypothetical protein